jgi:hypothetical protein
MQPAAIAAPFWRDPRFTVPAALLGGSIAGIAVAAVAARAHAASRPPVRRGFVLCPQGAGVDASPKPIEVGSDVALWLGDAAGRFVEATWAKVLSIDPTDPNHIRVGLEGEKGEASVRRLRSDLHGFRLGDELDATKDCIADVLVSLVGEDIEVACGTALAELGYPVIGLGAAPDAMALNNRQVRIVLRHPRLSGWKQEVVARVVEVSETGNVPTLRAEMFESVENAEHGVRPGSTFDVTWDCVTEHL